MNKKTLLKVLLPISTLALVSAAVITSLTLSSCNDDKNYYKMDGTN
jgi:hypothetical protein